ncbi:unnamed protein product, partial [Ixodes hexagonus]
GPRWVLEPPARLLFSNWTGATVRCSAEGEPRPEVWWVTSSDGANVSSLATARAQLLSTHDEQLSFAPFRDHQFKADVHRAAFRCKAHSVRGTILSTIVQVTAGDCEEWEPCLWPCGFAERRSPSLTLGCLLEDDVMNESCKTATQIVTFPALLSLPRPGYRYLMTSLGDLYVRGLNQPARFRCHTEDFLTRRNKTSANYAHYHTTDATSSQTPSVTFHSGHVTVEKGNPTDLVCLAQGSPPPKFKWYKRQGQRLVPVASTPSTSTSPTQMDGVLHWSGGVQVEDSGQYVCVASNNFGEARASLQLSVHDELSVALRPSLVRAEAGDSVAFQCNSSSTLSDSEVSLEWTLNGAPLPLGFDRLERGFVRVSSVARHQGGMLQCFVSSRDGHRSAQATAELVVGERAPRLEQTFETTGAVSPKSPASLGCRVSGDPPPTVTWTLDNAWPIVSGGPRLRLWSTSDAVSGDVISFLNWTSVEAGDSGQYECRGANAAGVVRHAFRLNVRAPLFVRPSYNETALGGGTARLQCPFGGYPYDRVVWFKDGSELPVNQRQTVFPNGTLLLETVDKSKDRGEYICSVDSAAGTTVQQTIRVIVRTGPQITPFRWLDELQEGMRAGLTCFVHSGDPPISLEWLKDGLPLRHAHVHSPQGGFMSALSLASLTPQDDGNYTCRASNAWASASHSAVLKVKVAPTWRTEPKDVVAITGHSVVVDCQAHGEPPPHIRWKTASGWEPGPYRAMVSSSRVHILVNGSLSVRSIETRDAGLYLCEASNGVGAELSKVVRLTVRSSPRLASKESTSTAQRGSTVHLECEPQGDIPMRFWWLKDGVPVAAVNDRRY